MERGWRRKFEWPIPIEGGTPLVTLKDAANHIMKLPKAEHEAEHWQDAIRALVLVADNEGHTLLARIGIMRALNHGRDMPRSVRKKAAKRYRIIR